MKALHKSGLLISLAVCLALACDVPTVYATQTSKKKQTTQAKKSAPAPKKKVPRETSSSVKKQEQNVNKEIRLTQQQIEENEAAVKENLALLTNLEHDIILQNQKVANLQAREKQLNKDIKECEEKIKTGEATLSALRARYISTVKKMRIARKKANPLAYIFASKSFYQAWRRMRYMNKFNEWRNNREAEIKKEIAELAQLNTQLAAGQQQLKTNLNQQQTAQQELSAKHNAQDEAVKALQSHGDALRKHLAQKQAEANALSAKVLNLIAMEQQEAAMAEQRKKEAAEKAAKEKAAKEKAAKEKAAKEKAEAEKAAAEKAAKEKAAKDKSVKEKAAKEKVSKDKKDTKPKETPSPKQEPSKQPAAQTKEKDTQDKKYAEARNRKPRSESESKSEAPVKTESKTTTPSPAAAKASASGFAALKGSLPKPATGSKFVIVSRFGRHPLPDLPDVMFDNPGIDAIVENGASAQAIYAGTVTGVYVLPGFSTVVIVSHGDHYTVYGNIGTPAVSKGDTVKQGQILGKLVSDKDDGGRTTIHFEIYKNRDKLNPEAWIK